MRVIGKNNLYRGLAIFFMLFTMADLINPHLCSEELESSYLPESLLARADIYNVNDATMTAGHSRSQEDSHSDSGFEMEDCFCCCSHILPSFAFTVDSIYLNALASDREITRLPIPPPQSPFHPPRLS